MKQAELELAKAYCPILLVDEHEPFEPAAVGVTILYSSADSPSFRRQLEFYADTIDYIIEYAIYWDYDIQHLYDLEHIWVYVARDGSVLNSEASFHGKYLKALLHDRSNLAGKRVQLFCQAGKHAFSPLKELFQLIPNFMSCTYEGAGSEGLIVTAPFQGVYESNDKINQQVQAYLQHFRFRPAERYHAYELSDHLLMSWAELRQHIPLRIAGQVKMLDSSFPFEQRDVE